MFELVLHVSGHVDMDYIADLYYIGSQEMRYTAFGLEGWADSRVWYRRGCQIGIHIERTENEVCKIVVDDLLVDESLGLDMVDDQFFNIAGASIDGDLGNITLLVARLIVFSNTDLGRIATYTQGIKAYVDQGRIRLIDYDGKTSFLMTFQIFLLLVLIELIGLIYILFKARSSAFEARKRIVFPWLTLLFSVIMMGIYLFMGTFDDFLLSPLHQWSVLLFAPLLHNGYNHLMSNLLLGFLLVGITIETWDQLRNKRVLLFGYPYAVSVLFVMLYNFFLGTYAVGSSLWIIGISIFSVGMILQNKSGIERSKANILRLLVLGFVLMDMPYSYLMDVILDYRKPMGHIMNIHLLFFLFALTLWLGIQLLRRKFPRKVNVWSLFRVGKVETGENTEMKM